MSQVLSNWILSIAGIVCLSVIVELVMPNGQMTKYIKGIFSFIIILVIIAPLPRLAKMDIDIDNAFSTPGITVQEGYLEDLNQSKLMVVKDSLEREIERSGYVNVTVSVNADIFQQKFEIRSIYVDLSLLVISGTAAHKDIVSVKGDIVNIIQNQTGLKKESIEFNE